MEIENYLYFSYLYLNENRNKVNKKTYEIQKKTLSKVIEFDNLILNNINSSLTNKQIYKKNIRFDLSNTSLTFALIIKDEEDFIHRCLTSIIDFCDEIIIVDTGSKDNTLQIIDDFNDAKITVYNTVWENNFALARNFAIDKTTSDWIFFIDADEYLDSENLSPNDLKNVLTSFNNLPSIDSTVLCPQIEDLRNGDIVIGVKRIFRIKSKIKYYGLIHEEARTDKNKSTMTISMNILLKHDGYQNEIMVKKNKTARNLTLLKDMLTIEPENKRWAYFYIRDGLEIHDINETKKLLLQNLKKDYLSPLTIQNLQINEFSFSFLDILASIYLSTQETLLLFETISCMDYIFPNNSNSLYYKKFNQIQTQKKELEQSLYETITYRKNNLKPEYGTIHSDGAHIDFLIGILLFETGHFKSSFNYFNQSKSTFNEPTILSYYEQVKEGFSNE